MLVGNILDRWNGGESATAAFSNQNRRRLRLHHHHHHHHPILQHFWVCSPGGYLLFDKWINDYAPRHEMCPIRRMALKLAHIPPHTFRRPPTPMLCYQQLRHSTTDPIDQSESSSWLAHSMLLSDDWRWRRTVEGGWCDDRGGGCFWSWQLVVLILLEPGS